MCTVFDPSLFLAERRPCLSWAVSNPSRALVPFPEEVVQTVAIKLGADLIALFTYLKDIELPFHTYADQWGTVVEGDTIITIGRETGTYRAGESSYILAGVEHGALIKSGTGS